MTIVLSRTPFRLSFLGGGSDIPDWFLEHGGCVVGTAINQYSYLAVRKLPPYHLYKSRLSYSQIETVNDNSEIKHGLIRESLKFLGIDDGVEISHFSDLPSCSGTGSSSSFLVGTLNALRTLAGFSSSKKYLYETANLIERGEDYLNEAGGWQDAVWASVGSINSIEFQKSTGDIIVSPLILSTHNKQNLVDSVMMFYTKHPRTASEITKSYKLIPDNLHAIVDLARQGVSALENGDMEKLGNLLDENWRLKKGLSDKISTSYIDDIYSTAKKCGAFGGKIMGAGNAGVMCFVAPKERQSKIRQELKELIEIPFGIDYEGSKIIYYADQGVQ